MSIDDEIREVRELLAGAGRRDAGGETPSALRRAWRELELPTPAPAPPGFARRVTRRAAGERETSLGLPLSPRLARLAAAAALVAGIAGGLGIGLASRPADATESDLAWTSSSFAEEFADGLASSVDPAADESLR